jgi:hypothetical protein
MFDQRQAWDHERDLAALEGRPVINSNLISGSPPKRIIRRNTQDIERDREIKINLIKRNSK